MSDEPVDSNGGALIFSESRTGPGLDYIGGKMADGIKYLHRAFQRMPEGEAINKIGPPNDAMWSKQNVHYAFENFCVSYLALHNMLALANEAGFVARLLRMSDEQIQEWLDRIYKSGSTKG